MASFFQSPIRWLLKHPVAAGLTLLILAGAFFWFTHSDKRDQNRPLVVKVTSGDIENTVTAEGSLKPSRYVDVGAQVSGQLKKIYVDIGDQVKKGQLLAEIDASVQAQKVAASKANLQSLEAQLDGKRAVLTLARSNATRQENLMRKKATTQQDYDNSVESLASATSALAQLQAQIAQAKAGLASDEAQLGYSKIFAPMSGTVIAVNLNEGQTLNAAQQAPTILRIADLSTMTVETSVSEADVSKLHPGMDVYFKTLGGGSRRWYGKLRQIWPTPQIVNNVVLYTALFDVGNKDGALLPDMTAQVFFITASARNVAMVPVGALQFPARDKQGRDKAEGATEVRQQDGGARGRLALVRQVNASGDISLHRIRIGVINRIDAQVISGLKPGDQVVAGIVQEKEKSADTERHPRFRRFP